MNADLRSPNVPRRPDVLARWLWQLAKEVLDEYQRDGISDVAASTTYWTILSIPAAVLALVSLLSSLETVVGASLANDVEAAVSDFVVDTFTNSETLSETVDELFNTPSTGIATVATLAAVFTLSRAFAGLIRALDIAYEVDDSRPWWLVRLVAIGLGVGSIAVVATGATMLAVLPSLPFGGVVRALAVPLVLSGLVIWAATVFHIGPNHRTPWRYDLPGAIVAGFGWLIATQGFAVYVRVSGQGNSVQSSVGAVLLALTLIYVLAVVLLLGAEVNDVLARRAGVVRENEPVAERAQSLRRRLRRSQDQ